MNLAATFVAQLVVFLILVWFAVKVVWPPLKKALDDRIGRIVAAMEAAERGNAELENASGRVNAKVAESQEEVRKLLNDYDRRAQTIIADARRTATVEAERIIASAKMEANQLLDRARVQLRAQLAEIAVVGAANILVKEIDATEHARLLAQLKDDLKE